MKAYFIILLGFFLFSFQEGWGQSQPINFTREQYRAGLQNWAFQQDKAGILYTANNEGLLTFHGARWNLFPLPNRTIVRSIAFGSDSRLYAGGQDELGFFEPDAQGRLIFHSLRDSIDSKYRQFADVWNIAIFQSDVFFQTSTVVFRLHNNQVSAYPSSSKWEFMASDGQKLVAQDREKGLVQFIQNGWQTIIPAGNLPADITVTGLIPLGQANLITTVNHGVFKWTVGNSLVPFGFSGEKATGRQHFTSGCALENGKILLGTYEHGVFYTDSLGNVLDVFTTADGLTNNNVKSIFTSNKEQIWLGLEDGISIIDLNHSIEWLNPAKFNKAAGYAAAAANGNLYFALANGLFEMPLESLTNPKNAGNTMQKIAGGLTWNVSGWNGRLLVGRDDGLFELKNDQLASLDRGTGYWICRPISNSAEPFGFAAGTYRGVSIFGMANSTLSKQKDLSSINTSARFLEYDASSLSIWVSHPYRGVFKIRLKDTTVQYYSDKQGLPSVLNNHVFKVKGKVLMATVNGVYAYDSTSDSFRPSEAYNKAFGGLSIRYLKEDAENNLWFVSDKKLGVLDAATQSVYYFPELERKILSGFEHIFPLDKHHVFVGGEQGFFVINYANYLERKAASPVFIRYAGAKEKHDSVLFGGYGPAPDAGHGPIRLSHGFRELRFEFSAPYSAQSANVEYAYRLKGLDDSWSAWSPKTEKDYALLPPGSYVFEVKARNNLKVESPVASFAFDILPPWYKTGWALIFYMLVFAGVLYLLYKLQEKRIKDRQEKRLEAEKLKHEEKQKLLAFQHQLSLEKSEKELIQLRNEKLESELAFAAMNLVQKKEFLHKIRDEINSLNKSGIEQSGVTELKKIAKELTAEDKLNEEWDQFSLHFNKVHNNFLLTLKNKFPQLSAHDLKLCAYLRMNLSSKEMARLMSISVRGVEINRYRLRKKLQLQPKENIFEFLMHLGAEDNPDLPTAEEQA